MKIESIDLRQLRTAESLGFCLQIAEFTDLVSQTADQKHINEFKQATDTFLKYGKATLTNSFTQKLKAANQQTDKLCSGLRMYVKANTFSPDENIRTLAQKVFDRISQYGNLARMSYTKQYSRLSVLLNELQEMPKTHIKKLGLAIWIDALSLAYENFVQITSDKISEEAEKQVGIVQDSRLAAEAAYFALVTRINAGVVVVGEEPYEEFVGTINVVVSDYKAHIQARKTRNENDG